MTDDQRGIVLDETTAPLVHRLTPSLHDSNMPVPFSIAVAGMRCSHIGGRPVAELVAAHDLAKRRAGALRRLDSYLADVDAYFMEMGWESLALLESRRRILPDDAADAADHLDRLADLLIDPALVAAWHAQHDGGAS